MHLRSTQLRAQSLKLTSPLVNIAFCAVHTESFPMLLTDSASFYQVCVAVDILWMLGVEIG